jgi:hypothetical protein
MTQPTRKDMDKRDIPNAYGRYSASDQVGDDEFKERGRLRGGDRIHRGDRSNEVPGTYEGSKGDDSKRIPKGRIDKGTGGSPRRGSDDYPKDVGQKG